ncbi:hypothetical protein [Desulfocicer niacini]
MTRSSAGGDTPGKRTEHEVLKRMASVQMDVADVKNGLDSIGVSAVKRCRCGDQSPKK